MSRSQRLLALLQTLRRYRRPVTARALARELAVSVRTVYRDIGTLVQQGAAIDGEAGLGYLLRPGFVLPPLMFQEEELEALVLGARWVALLPDDGLARAAHDAIAKVTAVLPPRLRSRVEDTALYPVPHDHDAAPPPGVDMGLLRSVIRQERKLAVDYVDKHDQPSRRIVWPVALAYFDRVRVLVAWCELRGGFRTFRTDRIVAAEPMSDPLPRSRAALLKQWQSREGIADDAF
jgi:predicted DNA-binding transcriptional regulator YafY